MPSVPTHSPLMSSEDLYRAQFLLGPFLIGSLFDAILFGVLIVQFLEYFRFYSDDATWIRVYVVCLAAISLLKTIHAMCIAWVQSIGYAGDINGAVQLQYTMWYIGASALINATFNLVPQGYFIYRLYVVSRRWWPCAIVVALLAYSFASLAVGTVHIFERKYLQIAPFFAGSFAGMMASDMVLTSLMCYYLTTSGKDVLEHTRGILYKLFRIALLSAAPSAILTIINLVFSQIWSGEFCLLSVVPNTMIPHVYALTSMLVLNTRHSLRMAGGNTTSRSDSNKSLKTRPTMRARMGDVELASGVSVHSETVQRIDLADECEKDEEEMEVKRGRVGDE